MAAFDSGIDGMKRCQMSKVEIVGENLQVHEWDEGSVEHGPDDVEFPLETLDPNGCDFNN